MAGLPGAPGLIGDLELSSIAVGIAMVVVKRFFHDGQGWLEL